MLPAYIRGFESPSVHKHQYQKTMCIKIKVPGLIEAIERGFTMVAAAILSNKIVPSEGFHTAKWLSQNKGVSQKDSTAAAKALGIENLGDEKHPSYTIADCKKIVEHLGKEW